MSAQYFIPQEWDQDDTPVLAKLFPKVPFRGNFPLASLDVIIFAKHVYSLMKKLLLGPILRLFVAAGFIGTIVWSYFYNHQNAGYVEAIINNKGVLIPVLLVSIFLVLGLSFARYVNKNSEVISLAWRPYSFAGVLVVFISFILSVYYAISPFTATLINQLTQGKASELLWTSMMWSFWGYALPILLFLTVLTLFVAGLGYRLFNLFQWEWESRLERMVLSTGLGTATLITGLALLALFGLFNIMAVSGMFVIGVLFGWNQWPKVLREFLWDPIKIELAYNRINWLWGLVLLIIVSFNIIDLIRPFPIGWDDLGVYMNFPRQLVMKEALLKGFSGQAFMLITSLGYMFGGIATWAMFLSWWGGIMALWAIYLLGKRFVNSEAGLLMASIMYSLPMIMHQSFADMKLDLPLFFFIVIAFYSLFRALEHHREGKIVYWWLGLSGLFWGIALAVKITTALALFPVFILIAWRYGSRWWALSLGFLLNAVYFYQFVVVADFPNATRALISSTSLIVALLFAVVALIKKTKPQLWLKAVGCILAGIALVWVPWGYKVLVDTPTWSVNSLLYTALSGGEPPSPLIAWEKIGTSPALCAYTGNNEELGRYIGNETNLFQKYTSVFWDLTMNINQAGFYVDISFLFLALIPLLLLFWRRLDWPQFWQDILLCFCLIWYFWLFVASGVPWYGLAGFLPGLLLVVRVKELSAQQMLLGRYLIPVVIVVSLLSTAFLREGKFANTGQMAYAFGLMDSQAILRSTNQSYPTIISAINSDTSTLTSPHYIYRIGTFINYFIDNNRERVYDDAQLDTFRCIDGDGLNDARTLERLKTLGFHYMVYDTNTETIERNPQGTLHRKTNRFKAFAFKNLKVIAPKDQSQYRNGIILFEIPL